MPNWAWFLVGAGVGFMVARSGGSAGTGLSFSVGAGVRGAPPGSGAVPLDQPTGSEPYQQVGPWDPMLPGQFPDFIDPGMQATIVDGGEVA